MCQDVHSEGGALSFVFRGMKNSCVIRLNSGRDRFIDLLFDTGKLWMRRKG